MLAITGILINLNRLGFSNITRVKPANGTTLSVHGQHYLGCLLAIHREKGLKHFHDKIHWREVIIQEDHPVHRRRLQFGARFLHGQTRGAPVTTGLLLI